MIRSRRRDRATFFILIMFVGLFCLAPHGATSITHVIESPPVVHVTFWLRGSAFQNWNQTSPGPLIVVTDGDLVTIMYNSIDAAPHTWFVDANNDGTPNSGEISSTASATSATFVNFTFTLHVGTGVPSTGDFTYRCSVHPTMMSGTFRVLASTTPDFTLGANPSIIGSLPIKTAGSSTISITPVNGFTGTVTLTLSTTLGLNASISPTSISGGSGTATLAVNSTTAGSYSVTVTGTNSQAGPHSVVVPVAVVMPDFKIYLSSTALTVAPGSSGTVTATLTSLNDFSGTVSLASTISSSGPQVTFSSTSLSLTPGGAATSTLTISTMTSGVYSTPVSTGIYNMNVTATSGSLAHSSTLVLNVASTSGGVDLVTVALVGGGIIAGIAVVVGIVYMLRRKPKT